MLKPSELSVKGYIQLVLIVVGLGLGGVAIVFEVITGDVRSWPRVAAKMEISDVVIKRQQGYTVSYGPRVSFLYKWKGRSYRGTRFSKIAFTSSDREAIMQELGDYAAGATVVAMVNPSDPAEAYLKSERSMLTIIFAAISILTLSGAAALWFWPARGKDDPAED